jgi:tetratricopeptide (TPR) repeat protein
MANGEGPLLESWKEISAYLKRSVRTCRRWESTLGLPVHRLDGTPSARVFANPAELDQWLGEKLRHIEADERTTALQPVLKKKTLLYIGGVVTVAIIVLGGGAALLTPLLLTKLAPPPGINPVLAILPFENPSGDEALEDWRIALPDLLITDLRQSRYLNVFTVRQIYRGLKAMKLAEITRLSDEDLSAITKRFEPDFTVSGKLEKAGDRFVVEIVLKPAKATDDPPPVLHTVARSEQELIEKADLLSREIKKAVGLTRRQIRADIDAEVRRVATASPEAWKLYGRADWPAELKPYPDMVPALEKALAIDSGFGLAYKLMYSAYGNQRPEDLVRCYEKALSCAGRMSERDLLELRADFYYYLRGIGYKIMTDAGIPASTIERLKPRNRSEALAVLERLADLYPDFFSNTGNFSNLVNIYMQAEEWDKAIVVLEKVAPLTLKRMPANTQNLVSCYLARGWIEKAERSASDLERSYPERDNSWIRREIALKERRYDEALRYAEQQRGSSREPSSYGYYAGRGYILWLADDLSGAEKAYRTITPHEDQMTEQQRAIDMAALSLSQGKIGQALAAAEKGLELAETAKDAGESRRVREFHIILAYLYRLAGRLPEALKQSEEACRDCQLPAVSPAEAVGSLHMRAVIALELDMTDEFSRRLEEIRTYCEREGCPKLMRLYHHLLGLQELRENRGQRAISELERALDLSAPRTRVNDPAPVHFSMAEAFESMGKGPFAVSCYDEIAAAGERGSLSGDVYALSFYRKAKIHYYLWKKYRLRSEDSPSRAKAIDSFRKFLSLWGDADPLFAAQVEDARRRLAELESE